MHVSADERTIELILIWQQEMPHVGISLRGSRLNVHTELNYTRQMHRDKLGYTEKNNRKHDIT